MTQMSIFQAPEGDKPSTFNFGGTPVRVIRGKDGEPVFVAKDVCKALGLTNSRMALQALESDEKDGVNLIDSIGRQQQTAVVTEAGLYKLIMRSDKPSAKGFQQWVTHDVLPAIRKTGVYIPEPAQAKIAAPKNRQERVYRDRQQVEYGMTLAEAVNQLQVRRDTKETYRQLCSAISELIEKADYSTYAAVANRNYLDLFGKRAAELKAMYKTDSVRDALPPLELQYLRTAEMSITEVLRHGHKLTFPEFLHLVDQIAIPLGKVLDSLKAAERKALPSGKDR